MLSGLGPIRIKKCRCRRLRRHSTLSTTKLLQSEESNTTGDTSTSGKVKASSLAPEPIEEEETADSDQEKLTKRELEEKKDPTEKKEDPKETMEELKENQKEPKEKPVERNQRAEELKENREKQEKKSQIIKGELKEDRAEQEKEKSQIVTEKPKEYKEESREEKDEKRPRRTEELEEDREEPTEKEESIQWRTGELKVKEEQRSQQMPTEEPKDISEEVERKNEELLEKIEEENGCNLRIKRIGEFEEEFRGSPSFRFYCRSIRLFDPEDSIILSGLHRSTEKLEEIKQNNEPIEVSESQASSKGSKCNSPKKYKGRRLLKLTKAPNAVRNLFTCYSIGKSCSNISSASGRY